MRTPVLVVLLTVLGAWTPARLVAADDPPSTPAVFRDVFEHADVVELVSIDPEVHRAWGYGPQAAQPAPLERWLAALREADGVYGRVVVADAGVRAAILHALAEGVAHPGPAAGCYDPRHALLARRGDTTVVVHLCFACHSAVFLDASTAKGVETRFRDQEGLRARLDGLLTAAHVPRARDVEQEARAPEDRAKRGGGHDDLRDPDAVDVYGIDPDAYRDVAEGTYPGDAAPLAHALAALGAGRGVRTHAALGRPSARDAVLAGVVAGLAHPGDPAKCYNPRHAVVVRKGERRVVFFLCFECNYAAVAAPDTARGMLRVPFGDAARLQARLDLILAAAPHAEPAAAQEAAAFDVILEAAGPNRLACIRRVRSATDLGLAACKALVESAPQPVLRGLSRADAEVLVAALASDGATAAIRPAAGPVTAKLARYDVVVTAVGPDVDLVVAAIEDATGQAKAVVRAKLATLPAAVWTAAWAVDARAFVTELQALGASAEARPSPK